MTMDHPTLSKPESNESSRDVTIVRRDTTRRSMLKLGLVAASLPLVMTLTAHEARAQGSVLGSPDDPP